MKQVDFNIIISKYAPMYISEFISYYYDAHHGNIKPKQKTKLRFFDIGKKNYPPLDAFAMYATSTISKTYEFS